MSLNTYLVLGAALAVVLSPLLLLAAPVVLFWYWMQTRARARHGLETLLPAQARTLEAYARAMVRPLPDGADLSFVSRNIDRFLSGVRSPRIWRTQALLTALELAPLLKLRLPFSRQSPQARVRFVDRYMSTTRGLFGLLALSRQLVRMGYYSEPTTHEPIGFVPMGQRSSTEGDL